MYPARIELQIFDGALLEQPSATDVAIFQSLLDALTDANVRHLRDLRNVPPLQDLMRGGVVRYADPALTGRDPPWRDVKRVLTATDAETRIVACATLATWYAAERRVRHGTAARCDFNMWPTPAGFREIHVYVREGARLFDPTLGRF